MPTICDQCGKTSYVTYVKANPGNICDVCEDRERMMKGKPNEWKTIQTYNHNNNYHPHKLKARGNVLYLQSSGLPATPDGWSVGSCNDNGVLWCNVNSG